MKKLKIKGIKRILSLKGEPKYIAKGFALGSFIGMMPIPGFQMLVSLSIASIFKVNKTAAVIGVFNTNLATGAFVFAFNFWLGKTILGISPNFVFPDRISLDFLFTVIAAGGDVFISLLAGGVLTGIAAWILSYHIMLYMLNKKQKKIIDQTVELNA